MNPDKLFDYLDGKLSPADRDQLETQLGNDSQLLRQLAVARDIHRNMRGSREVIVPVDDPAVAEGRGGRLGRRIATAAIVLVFLNVLIGVVVIAGNSRKQSNVNSQEALIRQQLATSLGAVGKNVLPAPTFVEDAVSLIAPRSEWENTAARVSAAAEKCGGSTVKGLPDDAFLTIVAEIPSARNAEFRRLLDPAATVATGESSTPLANERTIVQVRIAESAR
ncbi:MAG: hypothetical protein M3Z22_06860 [Verrucomicrobiota bacterium]|nr:hypothetical protein [Verrucomicrobiota bacterium]